MSEMKRVAVLDNEIEAQLLGSILSEKGIDHILISYRDTAYDGLFQLQKGWGDVEANEDDEKAILETLDQIRHSQQSEEMVQTAGVTVVGSVALDTVETPWGKNEDGLGGAATYFSLAACHYAQVNLVGVVGNDFPDEHIKLLEEKGICLDGLEHAEGKTFRWSGRYHEDLNLRDTLDTQLNVFEHFHPKLPKQFQATKYLFLGNIHPALQMEVLEQASPEFIALDTMNLWIDISLDELKAVLKKVDAIIINDSEVKDLTGENNVVTGAQKVADMGPGIVVVKKGEHGCLLFEEESVFAVPAFPLDNVVDPTGAGDSFAGGFMGYIAEADSTNSETLRQAVVHGSVLASFTCEAFGPDRLAQISGQEISDRFDAFRKLTAF